MKSACPHVLFISYNGLLEPLGQSQALAYVEELSGTYRFSILSYEKLDGSAAEARRIGELEDRLRRSGIEWVRLRYHKRPSLLATAYDVAVGIRVASRVARERRTALLHARGYVPAAIAWGTHRRCGIPYVFDVRGLQAEEYVDGGIWRPGSLPVRITKRVERVLLRDAAGIVTLTEAIRPHLRTLLREESREEPVPWAVVPCCVDLERFRPDPEERRRVRAELELGERPTLVYSGSVGTWYLVQEMLGYYREARAAVPDLALLLLVNGGRGAVELALRAHGISDDDVRVVQATPESMPGYLAAADVGISFIRPCLSKLASSPTKVGEYLASGLPVVLNRGIGDSDRLGESGAAQLLGATDGEIAEAARALPSLLELGADLPRRVAEEEFSLAGVAGPRYRALYEAVWQTP